MFDKKVNTPVKRIINNYRFNINDPVFCTIKNDIKNPIILSRYTIGGENFYKIGNKETNNTKICNEKALIHR